MTSIPCLFADTTSSVRRTQSMEQSNYGQFTHGHGGNPLKVLGAETYLDGNTLSIAQSLTELAQQPPHDLTLGWRFNENSASGTATPPILKARQAEVDLNKHSEKRKRSSAPSNEKPKPQSEVRNQTQAAKKKRKTRTSEDDDDGNEAEKKARGRPRLDTKDESAADRRRTQIRMAQRAYRNRKETTITSLEKQVEELLSMTEEMNSAFIGLYDLAVTNGLLQREPEFGRRLQSTTQRFFALAKSATAEETSNQENSVSPLSAPALPATQNHSGPDQGTQRQDSHRPSPEDELTSKLTTSSVWGYEISHSAEVSRQPAESTYATHTQRWFEQLPSPSDSLEPQREIVARATEANASFPFDMYHYEDLPENNTTYQTDYQLNFVQLPDQSSIQLLAPFNPWIQPPLPASYSHLEPTFGRRMHRVIVERGYKLLMNPDLAPETFRRVFGLTLRLYPKDMLAEAMRQVILRMKSEPLCRWDLPFVHLGGSGTHFPVSAQEDAVMPKVGTGRSIGPLIEVVSESQEKYLIDNYRGKVPGYEGTWFDTYDVEVYLRKRGVEIPSDADYITIDLDKVNLEEVAMAATTVRPVSSLGSSGGFNLASTATSHGTTPTPSTPETPYLNILGLQQRQQTVQAMDTSLEYFFTGMGNQKSTTSNAAAASNDMGNSADLASMLGPGDFTNPINTGPGGQRCVVVSVKKLMEAIMRKGICLGRAPGFRPRDVDRALRQTIMDAGADGQGSYPQFASDGNV